MILQSALLALAFCGAALCVRNWAGAPISVSAVLALVAFEALRSRQEWVGIEKLAKDSAKALIELNNRVAVNERAVKALIE